MRGGLAFEWDDEKAASNLAKHAVSFEYATRVFLDSFRVDFDATVLKTGRSAARRSG
jgi:uncharacterized DUF497 family protein